MSTDEASFLKAIRDTPADEATRLVYADWLDDRDDPRAKFARLSGEFLRCVRGLADLRLSLPSEWLAAAPSFKAEWLEIMDPLFGHFFTYNLEPLGEGIHEAVIREVHVASGAFVRESQLLFTLETDKAMIEVPIQRSGMVISLLVKCGDRVTPGQPLLTYLSIQNVTPREGLRIPVPINPPSILHAPDDSLALLIQALENRREKLHSVPNDLIEAMIARHTTAATMVFGSEAVRQAKRVAEMNLGGITNRYELHIEMLHVLLRRHGQPVRFRELPELPDTPPSE